MRTGCGVNLRKFLLLVMLSLALAGCHSSRPSDKLVGIINPNTSSKQIITGIINSLAAGGYVPGKNLELIECHDPEGIDQTLEELTSRQADLIFTVTTPATRKAKDKAGLRGIPIVFVLHDPVESGIIGSLPYPGGNLTGVQVKGSTPKALEWLHRLSPSISSLFVPIKFDTQAARQDLSELEDAARQLNINLVVAEVNTPEELENALASMPPKIDAIFIPHSIFVSSNIASISATAIKRKIPIGSGTGLYSKGATITYGMDWLQAGRQAGRMGLRILEGAPASSISTQIADFYLGINIKTAAASGIEIPNNLLLDADYISR